jgi:hypothetical protein
MSYTDNDFRRRHLQAGCAVSERPKGQLNPTSLKARHRVLQERAEQLGKDNFSAALDNARLRARVAELEAALREVMDVPRVVDEATVPRAGQNSAPEQVVYTLCVSYARLKRIEKLLEGYTP